MEKNSVLKRLLPLITTLIYLALHQVNAQNTYTNYIPCNKRIIGYYASWSERPDKGNYTVHKIPWAKLTHLNYAFAAVGSNNKIILTDSAAAILNTYPGQNTALTYNGQFNLIHGYKQQYPHIKTLISIGGWTQSGGFYSMSATAPGREVFANSCVAFLKKYSFDGIDIDWEYPTSAQGAIHPLDELLYYATYGANAFDNYKLLLKRLREKLDSAGLADNRKYLLSIAAPASSWTLGGMKLSEHCKYIDYLNIMSYDLHGAWNHFVGPQSAVYASNSDPETSMLDQPTLNIDWAVKYYSGSIHPSKINVGVPYYSRGWTQVSGGINGLWGTSPQQNHTYVYQHNGTTYTKTQSIGKGAGGIDGIWNDPAPEPDAGANPLWHVLNLLANPGTATYNYLQGGPLSGSQTNLNGYQRFFDNTTKTVWAWNAGKQTFLTYEDTASLHHKLDYIVNRGIGGMMFWELSGDYSYDAQLGYYTAGYDMTNYAYNYFATQPNPTAQGRNGLPLASTTFSYSFSGTYSHPNYTPHFYIRNLGTTAVNSWTVDFDLPKSARWDQTWGSGTLSTLTTTHPLWKRYRVVGPSWQNLQPGDSVDITGAIKLCFSGGPLNVVFNNATSLYEPALLPESCASTVPVYGVEEKGNREELIVYPNPGNGVVSVKRSGFDKTRLTIMDYKGKEVYRTDEEAWQEMTLHLNDLPNGLYLIRIENRDGKNNAVKFLLCR